MKHRELRIAWRGGIVAVLVVAQLEGYQG